MRTTITAPATLTCVIVRVARHWHVTERYGRSRLLAPKMQIVMYLGADTKEAAYTAFSKRANVLMLGYIDTPLARPAWDNEKVRQINLRQVPMRRFANPEEVATVAAFLASEEASYVNGVILRVDGGLSLNL